MSLALGQQVNVTTVVGGVSYPVSATLASAPPTITAPVDIATWNNNAANHVQWARAVANPPAAYLLTMLGNHAADWPTDGYLVLPGSQTDYDIGPGALAPDSYQLFVGSLDERSIPAATSDSVLDLAVFAYRDVQVSSVVSPPASATIKNLLIDTNDPTALIKGTTRQLNARAIYTDFSDPYNHRTGTWSSSNPAVVAVSAQGKLTALANGTAQISIAYSGFVATVMISVFQPTTISTGPATSSTALQTGPGHAGYGTLGGASLALPLTGKWTAALNGPVSYPVVANSKVFVTTAAPAQPHPSGYGSSLYALDVTSGAVVWGSRGSTGHLQTLRCLPTIGAGCSW